VPSRGRAGILSATFQAGRRLPGRVGIYRNPSLQGAGAPRKAKVLRLTPVRWFVFFYFFERVSDEAGVEIVNGQSSSLREILPSGLEIILLQ
jgi:hypothetical protein